jgi:hypothetical protein
MTDQIVPGCSIAPEERDPQAARIGAVARSVASVEREPRLVRFRLDAGFDRRALDELIATERRCCPFYELDVTDHTFTVAVKDEEHVPALDAFVELLTHAE